MKWLSIKMIIASLILCLFCTCYSPQKKTEENNDPFKRVPLTVDIIKNYSITLEELSQLQYYIKDSLVFVIDDSEVSKELNDNFQFKAGQYPSRNEITIAANKPGMAVLVYRRWQEEGHFLKRLGNSISSRRNDIILRVSFNDDPNKYLTFAPNDNGEYLPEFDFSLSKVKYGKHFLPLKIRDDSLAFNLMFDFYETRGEIKRRSDYPAGREHIRVREK